MAGELFGNRCVSYKEVPWHGMGFVPTSPISARDAFLKMGPYDVNVVPLNLSDSGEFSGRYAIMREATIDSAERVLFGAVTDDYALIPPGELCGIWDDSLRSQNLPVPVETMGALYDGRLFFISCGLPSFDSNGDQYNTYMLLTSEMDGLSAIWVRVVPVRVVCNNTLIAAKQAATESYRLIHGPKMALMLGEWLSELYDIAVKRAELLKETLDVLGQVRLTGNQAIDYLRLVYPDPKDPPVRGPRELVRRAEQRWEYEINRASKYRGRVLNLYNGAGTGLDQEPIAGTLCAALNAVVEYEDRREPSQGEDMNALIGAIWGERAAIKERAWVQATKFAKTFSKN